MELLLKQAKEAFADWQHLGRQRGYANKSLKRMAVNLLNHYPPAKVSHELGVLPATLKNWAKSAAIARDSSSTFVTLPLEKISGAPKRPVPSTVSSNLTLNLTHGMQLLIPEQSLAKTSKLIFALVKEFSSCSI